MPHLSFTKTPFYGGSKADDAWDVKVTPDGGYITAGTTGFNADFLLDALIVKFDTNGQVVWGRSYKRFDGYHENAATPSARRRTEAT